MCDSLSQNPFSSEAQNNMPNSVDQTFSFSMSLLFKLYETNLEIQLK